VESETAPRVEQYLSKIKVIRKIAGKIIAFLAQLEDFQKKLWLKKKFVVETQWCITVGCIPETFYAAIAANDAQREEWIKLFAIDEIKGDLMAPGFSKKLKSEFLKAHPTLVVDTRHFDVGFTARLLEAMGEVDEQTDAVLFHSDNCQAMRLAARRFAASVECSYIDPPYNTGNDGFIYRDNYRDSSWLAFIDDRLQALLPIARNDAALFVSIDDNEVGNLVNLIKGHSASAELVTLITAQLNPRGRTLDKYLAKTHEYIGAFALFGARDAIREIQKGEVAQAEYKERDEQGRFRLLELRNRNPVFNRANRPNLFFPLFTGPEGGDVTLERDGTHTIEILPRNSAGEDGCWTWGKEKAQAQLDELVARRANTGAWRVFRKDRLHGEDGAVATTKAKSIWADKEINNENGKELVGHLFGKPVFDFPKPVALIERCAEIGMSADGGVFIDFFGGSGTSGHAILNLNREDGGRRKFILVEMGDYFDTVLLPRLKKVTFTPEWKDGKPKRLATPEEAERSPRIIKVVRLESYEDALNNLETRRTATQQLLLGAAEAQGADGLKEQYILRYLLDVETRGSQSLLNVQAFTDPTAYKLKVKRPGSDESREVNVDLLETFNWLIGLTVKHIAAPQSFSAAFERDSEKRLRLSAKSGGRLKQDAAGVSLHSGKSRGPREGVPYWFRTVTGTTPDGRKALIIWRKLTGEPEENNLVLDEWFTKQGYSAKDSEFDLIYVNGGNNLENLKTPDDLWKVRLIEEDFHRLMFETEGV
jgi:adenine-specific DNA-methyltransferase